MPITIDGDGTITGLSAGGLPNDSVQLADMAHGTDGQIITYDASGAPVAVGPGDDGQVLTSTGSGSPPAFEAISAGYTKLIDKVSVGTGTSYDVTSIPAGVTNVVILHHLVSFDDTSENCLRLGKSAGLVTSGYYSAETYADSAIASNSNSTRFGGHGTNVAARTYSGIINLWHLGSNTWQCDWISATPQKTGSNTAQIYKTTGYVPVGGTLDRFSYFGHSGGNLDGGEISVYYI